MLWGPHSMHDVGSWMGGDGKLKSCSAKRWAFANGKTTPPGQPRNAGLAPNGPVGFLLARAELLKFGTSR